jgi:hypothetical protein
MSRTWREIPDNGVRDRDDRNFRFAYEEKKGRVHDTKKVRDKDNHGCPYSRPSDFKECHKKRYRRKVNQELNKLANECYDIPRHAGKDLTLPQPKEFQPYYW